MLWDQVIHTTFRATMNIIYEIYKIKSFDPQNNDLKTTFENQCSRINIKGKNAYN